MKSIPESSIPEAGFGVPINFVDVLEGEVVANIGSGAGIDVFLWAVNVKRTGKVIDIDMTDEMLEKARTNSIQNGYTNVEFRKGDVEQRIPVDNNIANVVISNCVINLTLDKVAVFKEIYRILKGNSGGMVISDLVTSKEVDLGSVDPQEWYSCIDNALTRENYIVSIIQTGFSSIEVLREKSYTEENEKVDGRKVTILVIKAVK